MNRQPGIPGRLLAHNESSLEPTLGLFGTCGTPADLWRENYFLPWLVQRKLPFFNPVVPDGKWTAAHATIEADHLARDGAIVFPVSTMTHGFGSLAEIPFAIIWALLKGQKISVFIEMPKDRDSMARGPRQMALDLIERLCPDFPIAKRCDSMQELANWARVTLEDVVAYHHSKMSRTVVVRLPDTVKAPSSVALFGTAGDNWREPFVSRFRSRNISTYNPVHQDWTSLAHIAEETHHKTGGSAVMTCNITTGSDGYGACAEAGWLLLFSILNGTHVVFKIDTFESIPANKDRNRPRQLIKAHLARLSQEYPGLVNIAQTDAELFEMCVSMLTK
ncbi:TPA: hypothetical protein DIU27_03895 [Candidatus Collierbacteria bacterium]|uniref:Uncharacterized protein n=1 Tax=Candidatus Collierbacteria bacterium GW2011_GWB2_44_22 TaxID=1618387 RepID=A0A0G1HVJ4_9BACT|nr:MAG: hypothetical protein UW31_C0003G0076 [Candidatus Collierbacteria bacterium GW2011_GWA2_44_13]KKT51091.1 MAG: hypothetical protein UW44_C0016G0002 [Candidatus Collierbacteria bacterium GW2011_GWB2_44_22]KKT61979.1 MAG: hypothetical protein UW56_C0014G0024 [Candidatus Collierbacteria bacterium GW2011_GWD1_44_27]KKT65602.1 MAG: hypothetical protein UW58_C0025G0016 [Candidatus Collierbacteria bacterium GW2011_GWC2_44_30]KKT68172.1 MAG: hypothetical protein UW64_C0027G0002 [Microgenomates gr